MMRHLIVTTALCSSMLMGINSCSSQQKSFTSEATLRWTGMLAADGCGFFLDIDGKEYKPSNEEIIPETFQQHDASSVRVTYEILEEPLEYTCGMLPARYSSTIKITEIVAR